jgi:hypothetical protein
VLEQAEAGYKKEITSHKYEAKSNMMSLKDAKERFE